jgi:hypothetical protein
MPGSTTRRKALTAPEESSDGGEIDLSPDSIRNLAAEVADENAPPPEKSKLLNRLGKNIYFYENDGETVTGRPPNTQKRC